MFMYVASGYASAGTHMVSVLRGFRKTVPQEVFVYAFLIFTLYAFFWLVGYKSVTSLLSRSRLDLSLPAGRRVSFSVVAFIAVAAIGVFGLAYFFHPAIGEAMRSSLTKGGYGKFFFITISVSYVVVQLLAARSISEYSRGSTQWWIFVAIIVLYCVVLWTMGGRGRAIFPILSAVLIWHYCRRELSWVKILSVAIPAMAILLVLPFLRESQSSVSPLDVAFGVENYRNFDNMYNLSVVVDGHKNGLYDFSFGGTQLCDIASDVGLGGSCTDSRELLMYELYGFNTLEVGFPISKPGEFYVSFGPIGSAFGGFLLGGLAAFWYWALIKRRFLFSMSVPAYLLAIVKGGAAMPDNYFMQGQVLFFVQFSLCVAVVVMFDGAYKVRVLRGDVKV